MVHAFYAVQSYAVHAVYADQFYAVHAFYADQFYAVHAFYAVQFYAVHAFYADQFYAVHAVYVIQFYAVHAVYEVLFLYNSVLSLCSFMWFVQFQFSKICNFIFCSSDFLQLMQFMKFCTPCSHKLHGFAVYVVTSLHGLQNCKKIAVGFCAV